MALSSPRSAQIGYQTIPENHPDALEWCRMISRAVRGLLSGKMNVNTTVTLTANSATTTVTDERIGSKTIIHVAPTTSNAAAALGGLYQTYPNTTAGTATLNHANNAQTDKIFAVSFIG